MRISDWSSDVCSSDLSGASAAGILAPADIASAGAADLRRGGRTVAPAEAPAGRADYADRETWQKPGRSACRPRTAGAGDRQPRRQRARRDARRGRAVDRSEEHTSELQSLMRIAYAVFCL